MTVKKLEGKREIFLRVFTGVKTTVSEERKWTAEKYNKNCWAVFCGDTTVADCFNNPDSEANARLMAAAPELYKLVIEELIPTSDYGGILSFMREARIRKVLDFIDGEEDGHE